MRPIKFRAWDSEKKVMYYTSSNIHAGWIILTLDGTLLGTYYEGRMNPIILLQFTGLKDKNWKEIYEGDIGTMYWWKGNLRITPLSCWSFWISHTMYEDFNLRVSHIFGDNFDGVDILNTKFEIIWNIYENPDLLK